MLAHTAEKHAAVIVANVRALLRGTRLAVYPPGGALASPVIFAVSLGPYAALIEFAGVPMLYGRGIAQAAAARAKAIIEITKVAALAQNFAAVTFWHTADMGANAFGMLLGALGY